MSSLGAPTQAFLGLHPDALHPAAPAFPGLGFSTFTALLQHDSGEGLTSTRLHGASSRTSARPHVPISPIG
jgi:hypothetical protein